MFTAESLGSAVFKKEYNLKYAYVAGGMYKGIASEALVAKMGRAGMMGFFGTGGLGLDRIEAAIQFLKKEMTSGETWGMNLLNSSLEAPTIDLYLHHGITLIEAAAYMRMTPGLVRYRLTGLSKNDDGSIQIKNRIIAKISRPEVAEVFMSPAPEKIVAKLLDANQITLEQAELSQQIPMACDVVVEADSGGHTDMGVAYTLMPAITTLRDNMMKKYNYADTIRIGAAGGIGTPQAAAAAFILGADFILTGSINQCTVEGGISDTVKNLLQKVNVQDTAYAPAGDMFELGAKVQVLKKGVFFPARANKLYSLYQHYNSLDEIDDETKQQLQEKYFKCSFDDIYNDCKAFYSEQELEKAEKNPKYKMAMIFRWYFGFSTRLALTGDENHRMDFQVQCGPALGAFNQWIKGTALEDWRNRHVDEIAEKLIHATADYLNQRIETLSTAT